MRGRSQDLALNFKTISWNSYQDSRIKNLVYLLAKARYYVAPKIRPEGKVAHRLCPKQYYVDDCKKVCAAPK